MGSGGRWDECLRGIGVLPKRGPLYRDNRDSSFTRNDGPLVDNLPACRTLLVQCQPEWHPWIGGRGHGRTGSGRRRCQRVRARGSSIGVRAPAGRCLSLWSGRGRPTCHTTCEAERVPYARQSQSGSVCSFWLAVYRLACGQVRRHRYGHDVRPRDRHERHGSMDLLPVLAPNAQLCCKGDRRRSSWLPHIPGDTRPAIRASLGDCPNRRRNVRLK